MGDQEKTKTCSYVVFFQWKIGLGIPQTKHTEKKALKKLESRVEDKMIKLKNREKKKRSESTKLFNMSILPDRLVHFCAQLLYVVSHFQSQLLLEHCEVCCGDHGCFLSLQELPLVLLLQPQCCAWPRSCPSVPARGVDHRRSTTMSNASLLCGTLDPTRMRWECGKVRVTKVRKGSNCARVQVSNLCTDQHSPSA